MMRNLSFLIFFIAINYATAFNKKEGCPKNLILCNDVCVKSCSLDKNGQINSSNEKVCPGTDRVTSNNIDSYRGCNIINGSITISYYDGKKNSVNPKILNIFNSVRIINGYLKIEGPNKLMQNLTAFKNLEIIGGDELCDDSYSFVLNETSLTSIALTSLKQISAGDIYIKSNEYLCYAHDISWNNITKSPSQYFFIENNNEKSNCLLSLNVCDNQCSSNGCWSSGPDQCLSCKKFNNDGTCVRECPPFAKYNSTTNTVEQFSNGKYTYKHECLSKCPEKTWVINTTCVDFCPFPKHKGTNECLPEPVIFTKNLITKITNEK
ncbi:hypothetical protein HCN44_002378 [Aphidius gifuensis]|uniref:receptor protein-tyrosine kinase n=1 Tax=Aphidius gifuensis TaxID=684658 RepID=A0A834Y301_APHGI|nr:hypothetical protein HCN44_002378 [Aphidius gifuensis]